MKFALGKKLGMTTLHDTDGAHNVTLIEITPNTVDLVRNDDKDGYSAVRLSAAKTTKKQLKVEFRTETISDDAPSKSLAAGQTVDAAIFEPGDKVKVSAVAKGKGFQGVVKRHGFKGGPASHGHRHVLRSPGSIGSAFPQHVVKGKRMAGRDGGKRATNKGLKVILVDTDRNIVAVKGSVPGVAGRMVEIVTMQGK